MGSIDIVSPLDKGMIHPLGGAAQDFTMLLRTVHKLKLMNYLFLAFSIECFWTMVDHRQLKPQKGDYGTYLTGSW